MITSDEIKRLNQKVEIPLFLTFMGCDPKNITPLHNHTQYRTNCWYRGGDNPSSLGILYEFSESKWRLTDYIARSVVNEDLIGFAMKIGNKSFKEAVDLLIFASGKDNDFDMDGLKPAITSKQENPTPIDKGILNTFEYGLHPYWASRGYTPEIAEYFKLGWSNNGELKDRVIIPVFDEKNNLVSVQGRTTDDRLEPRYKFLYETGTSAKLTIYNFNRARVRAMERGWIGITEGASSVWRAQQHGFGNFVATLSTSVTDRQINLLMREDKNLVIVMDYDDTPSMSGQVAAVDLANKLKARGHKGIYIANIGFHAGLDDLNHEQLMMTLKNATHYA